MSRDQNAANLVKVTRVATTMSVSQAESFQMLLKFLKTEQEKQDDGAIQQSHWEDLYRLTETLASDASNVDQAKLRELRLTHDPVLTTSPLRRASDSAIPSPSPKQHIVFADEGTDEGTSSEEKVKKEETEMGERPQPKAEGKDLKRAARKKAKKEKREAKKAKKRKRESADS